MPNFDQGRVVRVPFPYTDRPVRQYRPALVVTSAGIGDENALAWVLMITSAQNRPWPGDVPFDDDYEEAGLPAPSVVRTAKIATIESRHAGGIGSAPDELLRTVMKHVGDNLGLLGPTSR